MNKISTLLVAGSLVAFSAPAMAQDTGSFDGFRIQGVAGYDALKAGSSVDDDANADNALRISRAGESRIDVLVIPTDEERMIALHTLALLEALQS